MGKLSILQVLEIAVDDRPYAVVAAEYGISSVMVGLIRTGQRYAYRTGIDPQRSHIKLTAADRSEIATSLESTSVLASRFGVHPSTVRKVRARPE